MLNADHSTFNPNAALAPAYGWFMGMEKIPSEGLYAQIELTDLGVEAIRNKHYGYISAETWDEYTDSTGQTFENVVSGAALTNTPFHDTMPGLFGRKLERPRLLSRSDAAQFWAAEGGKPTSPALPEAATLQMFAQRFSMDGTLNFDEVRERLCQALKAETARFSPQAPPYGCGCCCYAYVLEVYPEFFIYEEYSDAGGEHYFRRDYTLDAAGAVTLGAEKQEVEQVWVTAARAAMALARQAAQNPRAHASSRPAGKPAHGESMKLLDFTRKRFSLPETATEDDAVAALAADTPAPAVTPAEETQVAKEPGAAALSRAGAAPAEVQALQRQVQELDTRLKAEEMERQRAEDRLKDRETEETVQRYAQAGKLSPAMLKDEAGKQLRAFAKRDPEGFAAIYDAAPAVIDLRQHGVRSQEQETAETLETFAAQLAQRDKLPYPQALRAAMDERPDLYEKYRAGQPGGTN
jgi:hypothetical protein